MWFEWLVHQCNMGALAAVSQVQPLSGVEQQGSENITSPSTPDVANMWSRRKAERRARAPHVFPPVLPLSNPTIVSNNLISSPLRSPCFDNNLCKDLGYHAGPGGLRALSISLLDDANDEGGPCMSEPLNQLTKIYLQTMQELKQSRFNQGYETPFEPERYKELKAGFWKRLATDSFKDELCDSTSVSGAQASDACFERKDRPLNATTKKKTVSRIQGNSAKRIGLGLNGLVEIEVVLTGKWNALEESIMAPKPNLVVDKVQNDVGHVQNVECGKKIQGCQQVILLQQDEIDQPSVTEKDHEGDTCRTREVSDGESLEGDNISRCIAHPFEQQLLQQDSSECGFNNRGGIGRGHIEEDGSPTSSSSNHQMCEESKAFVRNQDFNMKEEDDTFGSNANWCVVDSYMTVHGKETTWTVCGFEEDDGLFQGDCKDCKDRNALKIFATKIDHSHFNELPATQFLPLDAPNVESQHGPLPKWTQQALQEQVAKNLQAQQKELRHSLNACAGSNTHRNNLDKEVPNLVKHHEVQKRKKRWTKKKMQSQAAFVACCISMIDGTMNILRKTREDATTLALKLVELQATEVKFFKSTTSAIHTHVKLLRSEVEGLETMQRFNVLMVFPWQQFFKNIVIGISLVSGTLGLHRAIKSLFGLLFGRAVQATTSKKEKTIIAVIVLCSGSYTGKEMWQIFSQVQAKKKINEDVYKKKLHLVLEGLSQMSTLTHIDLQEQQYASITS